MSRILIVDDEEDICAILGRFLTKKGYEVVTASDGFQALEKVKEFEPDIVLLDIVLPGISGMEVLRLIKETDEKIPVIMLTALRDVAVSQNALSMGASDYITKPFDLDYLKTALMAKISVLAPP